MNPDQPPSAPTTRTERRVFGRRPVLYPDIYVWFVFFAALDILLTYIILSPVIFEDRGREVNAVAEWIIKHYGLPGMVVYKFSLVMLIVCICELVGRLRDHTGRRLAKWCVALTAIPVVVSVVLIVTDLFQAAEPET